MKNLMNAMAILAIGMAGVVSLSAQGLTVQASGQKTVTLSDAVGKNQFSWLSDAPLEKIQGTSAGVTGRITLDPRNLSTIRGTIATQVSTMRTGNSTRDGHLRGSNWLDASTYPMITFTILSVANIKVTGNNATGTVTGNFVMHGVTKRLSFPFNLKYVDESAQTRSRASGDLVMINAQFDIKLKDFNVAGARGMVGSRVGETIRVTAQLFGSTGG